MGERYSPQVNAMPNPFSIIPPSATDSQVENIMRGLLGGLTKSLPALASNGDLFEGDVKETTHKVRIASPELMAASFVRTKLGGRLPADIVGMLNLPANERTGNYDLQPNSEGDYPMEGSLFDKVKKGVAKASQLANSSLGQKILGAAKLIPGLGSVVGIAEKGLKLAEKGIKMADKFLPGKMGSIASSAGAKLKGLTSKGADLAKLQAKNSKELAGQKVKAVLANPTTIIPTLVNTFGEKAVSDAILNIVAQEGDLYNDLTKGKIQVSPITLTGDLFTGDHEELEGDDESWMNKLQDILASGAEGIENAATKIKASGAKAYDKLSPKVAAAWESPWGKAAAGGTAVASAALLYYGVSKAMADPKAEKQAADLLKKKKDEADKIAAATRTAKAQGTPLPPPPTFSTSMPVLPPLNPEAGQFPSFTGVPPALVEGKKLGLQPGSMPGESEVTEKFMKIPFMGVSLSEIYDRGASTLSDWTRSLMKVNPLMTGDIPEDALEGDSFNDYFGSNFILHGFPVDHIRVIFTSDIPQLDAEIAMGHLLTSPNLTRSIITAAMSITDHLPVSESISIKDKAGNWRMVSDVSVFSSPKPGRVGMPAIHPRSSAVSLLTKDQPSKGAGSKIEALGDLMDM